MKQLCYISAILFVFLISPVWAKAPDISSLKTDSEIEKQVEEKIKSNLFYDVFDWIEVKSNNGSVTLSGYVNDPWDKGIFEKIAKKVEGVKSVTDNIEKVNGPDNLRYRAVRAIYGNSMFRKYSGMKDPPVHIIVNNNSVLLKGEVSSEIERGWASTLLERDTEAFRVQNHLTVSQS